MFTLSDVNVKCKKAETERRNLRMQPYKMGTHICFIKNKKKLKKINLSLVTNIKMF